MKLAVRPDMVNSFSVALGLTRLCGSGCFASTR